MNVKVADLMVPRVFVAMPSDKISYIREVMKGQGFHAVPVIDAESRPIGIVTSHDLVDDLDGDIEVADIMTGKVVTVPQYDDIHVAAKVMLNHRLHHVVVTHEQEIVGILSSFDLMRLVGEKRFIVKNPPTKPSKRNKSSKSNRRRH